MGAWLLLLLLGCGASSAASIYLSSWAVRVPSGPQEAQRLARRHGLLYLGQVIAGEPYFHLKHRGVAQKSLTKHRGWHLRLKRDPQIPWFEQQALKRRRKRAATIVPTDPWFHKQWYMNNDITPDLNVLTAWSQGYTGLGVVVSILDDGVEKNHPDLEANYDPLASYDFNDNDPDPQPRYNRWNENRHGTRCAGEVAAAANNHVCGAGIAYGAKIGGVRMLDGDVNDIVEAQSLSLQPQHIDIYSASWGPEDDGKTVDGPGVLAREAFRKGVANGRGGLGSLFVWASGNGGLRKDNCNCDGYTNSIYTLSVGSTTESGRVPWYTEACASTLTATYSSGAKGEKQIVTTDLRHTCTSGHTGTSASAPLAAGLIALALEANPALTWRDMQHLVVRASSPAHLQADDWVRNGVGRQVSHYYGYGLLNGGHLVEMAKKWQRTRPQRKCFIQVVYKPMAIGSRLSVSRNVSSSPCLQRRSRGIRSLEHVQVQLWLTYSRRGDLAISLTSPMGTTSTLVDVRPYDTSREGYKDWSFMSTHYWDEDPQGTWTLLLENKGDAYNTGLLKNFVLKLYGNEEDMAARQAAPFVVAKCVLHNRDGTCQECPSPLFAVRHLCLSYCPPRYYRLSRQALHPNGTRRTIRACDPCDPSCYTCLAGSAHNCSACPSHSTYEGRTHTCPRSPSFAYLPRGGLFALGDTRLLLLVVAVLLGLGPAAFCTFYALCRTRRRKLVPSEAEAEAVSLELLYLHRPGAKENLNRVS
ncbi:proprotein convertase subtilisin/kexin type 4-like [Pseudonaja textilis]|uniref:proprotein convertase subtilisin/kexin type 4-like n=1 Tax=Pseudonaja textilis TaxID=8673 RepID=UPI000EAA851E|nr:proprotein convertase subtilisin/kexin type 4-like [Pseudonaja textilis]